jgi:hypothetical protein
VSSEESPWGEDILSNMEDGCVTFAWDDGEIRTIEAPAQQLDDMRLAWEWVGPKLKELERERGRPRSVCFRLSSGEFRGLKFPDRNTVAS